VEDRASPESLLTVAEIKALREGLRYADLQAASKTSRAGSSNGMDEKRINRFSGDDKQVDPAGDWMVLMAL
jgi:hypothetical protein